MVYIELVINVLGFIIGVDFVVIYGVLVCGCYVVVLVVMLLFGVIIIVVDLIEVVVSMLVGLGFDIVYVVLQLMFSGIYWLMVSVLWVNGIFKVGCQVWYFNFGGNEYWWLMLVVCIELIGQYWCGNV